jgi:hypothetical protein
VWEERTITKSTKIEKEMQVRKLAQKILVIPLPGTFAA